LLDEIMITKGEFATKSDILVLDKKIDKLENKVDKLENKLDKLESKIDGVDLKYENKFIYLNNKIDNLEVKLVAKLGGIMVACTTIIAALITIYR
jgi:predicted RNase H-like nuclease (RuvC/YqgF family)